MDFDAIQLKLASPEEMLSWSHGEVIKPETINYRTQRPEKDGLFSERIFGPTKDWECYCGKYKKIRYKGIVCDKCGVEVTRALVRRERMGHIQLAVPVAHIWFMKSAPSKLSIATGISLPQLEKVVYYASYVVTAVDTEARDKAREELGREYDVKLKAVKKTKDKKAIDALKTQVDAVRKELTGLAVGMILGEGEFHELSRKFGGVFEASSGAAALRKILERINMPREIKILEKELASARDPLREQHFLKRLKLFTSLNKNGMRPEWMVLTMLPVLPPDLRPMVALDGGRYATSDLNDLYRRVINRNNRLKKLIDLKAPEVIVRNEKRMLQEAVDALIDNSARFGGQQISAQKRPLRSLADMLKGKQGRFRQNLLGKRVDYSGRSVIVVGPELGLGECALPKRMALELFRPFVIQKILERNLAYNIRNANRLIEQGTSEVWAILEEVIANRKVLLNRAPTLHRLGIQAFKPLLIEDLAIRIPPAVCTAFNADFDGDQMAVHVPLSDAAQKEASDIMYAPHNLLKPATGDPIITPTQDIVLGCYYLTKIKQDAFGAGRRVSSDEEALIAYENGAMAVNAPLTVGAGAKAITTTVGRICMQRILPPGVFLPQNPLNKKELVKLTAEIVSRYASAEAVRYLDRIKEIGFEYATRSGVSWGIDDLITPKEKKELIARGETETAVIQEQYAAGLLTPTERRARIISVWERVKSEIAKLVPKTLDPHSSVYYIIDSGARGSWSQPVQMMGMKGLVVNPQNEIIELPIKSSYKEGFDVLEYFISTHGARKGTTDTSLKTAQAGYLTRRLVDVAQDLVIREEDCGAAEGIEIFRDEGELNRLGATFATRIFSRTALHDVKAGRRTLIRAGEIIDHSGADAIHKETAIKSVWIRSPITCKSLYAICAACYGYDLSVNRLIGLGEAVGIVAAQSIGEPGTQLTMKTFHIGGVAGTDITHGLPRVEELFEVRSPRGKVALVEKEGSVAAIEDRGSVRAVIVQTKGKGKKGRTEYLVPVQAELLVNEGDAVDAGQPLVEGPVDPQELFRTKGPGAVQQYIIKEIQRIYLSEGASINNKHIELIIRQMFSRVRIQDSGDSHFVTGDVVEKSRFIEENRKIRREGGTPAKARQLLLGIIKAALTAESFLSAASFQQTARILISAATDGKIDTLRGLKENVIIGRLIPAGTGFRKAESPQAAVEESEGGL